MSHKAHAYITGFLFLIVAALHLVRAAYGWDVFVGSVDNPVSIPIGMSWILGVVAAFLSYYAFTLHGKKR